MFMTCAIKFSIKKNIEDKSKRRKIEVESKNKNGFMATAWFSCFADDFSKVLFDPHESR